MSWFENYWNVGNVRRRQNMRPRFGRGRMDGSQQGRQAGGRGQNRTDKCRHPEKKRRR